MPNTIQIPEFGDFSLHDWSDVTKPRFSLASFGNCAATTIPFPSRARFQEILSSAFKLPPHAKQSCRTVRKELFGPR